MSVTKKSSGEKRKYPTGSRIKCCVCKLPRSSNLQLTFYRLPENNEERRQKWISILKLEEKVLKIKFLYVCSRHFKPKDVKSRNLKSTVLPIPFNPPQSVIKDSTTRLEKVQVGSTFQIPPNIITQPIPPTQFTYSPLINITRKQIKEIIPQQILLPGVNITSGQSQSANNQPLNTNQPSVNLNSSPNSMRKHVDLFNQPSFESHCIICSSTNIIYSNDDYHIKNVVQLCEAFGIKIETLTVSKFEGAHFCVECMPSINELCTLVRKIKKKQAVLASMREVLRKKLADNFVDKIKYSVLPAMSPNKTKYAEALNTIAHELNKKKPFDVDVQKVLENNLNKGKNPANQSSQSQPGKVNEEVAVIEVDSISEFMKTIGLATQEKTSEVMEVTNRNVEKEQNKNYNDCVKIEMDAGPDPLDIEMHTTPTIIELPSQNIETNKVITSKTPPSNIANTSSSLNLNNLNESSGVSRSQTIGNVFAPTLSSLPLVGNPINLNNNLVAPPSLVQHQPPLLPQIVQIPTPNFPVSNPSLTPFRLPNSNQLYLLPQLFLNNQPLSFSLSSNMQPQLLTTLPPQLVETTPPANIASKDTQNENETNSVEHDMQLGEESLDIDTHLDTLELPDSPEPPSEPLNDKDDGKGKESIPVPVPPKPKRNLKKGKIYGRRYFVAKSNYCTEDDCDFKTCSDIIFQAHLRTHRGETRPFHCTSCDNKYRSIDRLKLHRAQKHGTLASLRKGCSSCMEKYPDEKDILLRHCINRFIIPRCKVCSKGFESEESCREHEKLHEERSEMSCVLCNELFYHQFYLAKHVRNSHEDLPTCPYCDIKFNYWCKFKRHKCRLDPNIEILRCTLCTYKTSEPLWYRKHMRGHEKNIICLHPDCEGKNRRFEFQCDLKYHNEKAHSDKKRERDKKNACLMCGKKFNSLTALSLHIKLHKNERTYLCDKCPLSFNFEKDLIRHNKVCGEKPTHGNAPPVFTLSGISNARSRSSKDKAQEADPLVLCPVCELNKTVAFGNEVACEYCRCFYFSSLEKGLVFSCELDEDGNCRKTKQDESSTVYTGCKSCRWKKCLQAGLKSKQLLSSLAETKKNNENKIERDMRECLVCRRMTTNVGQGKEICKPCIMFFVRCSTKKIGDQTCEKINSQNNEAQCVEDEELVNCDVCRYKKCIRVGLVTTRKYISKAKNRAIRLRREGRGSNDEEEVEPPVKKVVKRVKSQKKALHKNKLGINDPCSFCGGKRSCNYSYGPLSCLICRSFFSKYIKRGYDPICFGTGNCSLENDEYCSGCKFKHFISSGMKREAVPVQANGNNVSEKASCLVCGMKSSSSVQFKKICQSCCAFFKKIQLNGTNNVKPCLKGGNCKITHLTRNDCRSCRLIKCREAGMESQPLPKTRSNVRSKNKLLKGDCAICGEENSSKHYGSFQCESCYYFFAKNAERRGERECSSEYQKGNCQITKETRGKCAACRLDKCIRLGMQIGKNKNLLRSKKRLKVG